MWFISLVRPRATHEGNKSHNHELKADKRLIFTLAKIPQGMHRCHWQVSRLLNYVSFSKSHFKLVVRSKCQKQPKEPSSRLAVSSDSEPEVEAFITETKAASVAVQQELSEKKLESSFAGAENEQAVDNFNFRTEDLSTNLHVYRQRRFRARDHYCNWQGNSVEEWSKITTKHKEVNYMSSWSTRVWDDWLKNGTPYHVSDTSVEP